MLVKVKPNEFQILRELEVETYGDTFGPYISDADMEDYYQTVLSLEQIQKDLADPESETYFVLDHNQEICGFLKFNWGKAQTEPVEMDNAFEIQRIYVKKEHHGKGYGKEMFRFALMRLKNVDLTGPGWVSGNEILRPKTFTNNSDLNGLASTTLSQGKPWIQTGCCANI